MDELLTVRNNRFIVAGVDVGSITDPALVEKLAPVIARTPELAQYFTARYLDTDCCPSCGGTFKLHGKSTDGVLKHGACMKCLKALVQVGPVVYDTTGHSGYMRITNLAMGFDGFQSRATTSLYLEV